MSEQENASLVGMVPRAEWEKSDIHAASSYSCGKCGERFESPHDVYAHLDAEHPEPKTTRRRSKDDAPVVHRMRSDPGDAARATRAAQRRADKARAAEAVAEAVAAKRAARAALVPEFLCDACGEEFVTVAALSSHSQEQHATRKNKAIR